MTAEPVGQALLVISLLFALPINARATRRRVTRWEWTWAVLLAASGRRHRHRRQPDGRPRPHRISVVGVLSAIAIVPSPPVMVPELASGAAAELADLREAVFSAAAALPPRWVAVGVGPSDAVIGPRQTGTFAGYGVDVRVALSPGTHDAPEPLPLCALITGWVRGQAAAGAQAEVRVYADALDVDAALARGSRLRAEIDEAADPIGVLVVADGLHTLTPPAPGGYEPDSIPLQDALDDALAAGDAAALTRLPSAVVGRVAYQVLAGLVESPRSAEQLYRGAPYGVGYFAGVWLP